MIEGLRHGVKNKRYAPYEDEGQEHPKDARSKHDRQANAGIPSAFGKILFGFVFRYELGNRGLNAEVEVSHEGAQLQDKHPCAVSFYGEMMGQVSG